MMHRKQLTIAEQGVAIISGRTQERVDEAAYSRKLSQAASNRKNFPRGLHFLARKP